MIPRVRTALWIIAAISGGFSTQISIGAVPNSLVMNEVNTVSGGSFLDKGRSDSTLGRVEGNGQNWFEFLVVQGDTRQGGGFKNTLDLRGWTIEWSYDKQLTPGETQVAHGSGVITFTDDPLWAAVPRGTMLTVSEWQDAWYLTDTSAGYDPFNAGGLQRAGGINGLGHLRGVAYDGSVHMKLGATSPGGDPHVLATNTAWNPAANGGGANGDWSMHVFAGERNPDSSFKYFTFSGSVTDSTGTYAIGTDDGGLFAMNNDNWQFTIKDRPAAGQQPDVIQGPIGEQDTGIPGTTMRVSSTEIMRLEAFDDHATQPTQAQYLAATIAQYADGSTGTFAKPNEWSSGAGHQGLLNLRNWLRVGDADLDGIVGASDFVVWRNNANTAGDWLHGDFSGDGLVDQTDYGLWRAHFGEGGGGGAAIGVSAVPEPGALMLLLGWAAVVVDRRRGM